jgi:hypothetical protein
MLRIQLIAIVLMMVARTAMAACSWYPSPSPWSDYADPRVFNCRYYLQLHADLRTAFGSDCNAARSHWLNYGINEGRNGSPAFHPAEYLAIYSDISNAYGPYNYAGAISHFLTYGDCEGRIGHFPRGAVYADDSVKVMDVPFPAFAYALNVTYVAGQANPYMAVFDAEKWADPSFRMGDSTGVRYGTAYDFGTHNFQSDYLIARSTVQSDWMNAASNPLTIKIGGLQAFFWTAVKWAGPQEVYEYPMVAFMDAGYLGNVFAAPMYYHSYLDGWTGVGPNTPGYGAMVNHDMSNAYPIFTADAAGNHGYEILKTEFNGWAYDRNDGQYKFLGENGFLGNITTAADGKPYFYYTDYSYADHHAKLYRREIMPYLTAMGPRVQVADLGWGIQGALYGMNVNYSADLGKYIAVHGCSGSQGSDICVRTFDSMDLPGLGLESGMFNIADQYGIGIQQDYMLPNYGGPEGIRWGQIGIRKDPLGRHFSDQDGQVIIYIQPSRAGTGDTIWGDYYAKRVYINHDYF